MLIFPPIEPDDPDGRLGGEVEVASSEQGILSRAEGFSRRLNRAFAGNGGPLAAVIDDITSPVEALVGGKKTLLFGTNSYLGLNFHPACIGAAADALHRHGTGSTASRVASGNSREHVELELEVASFYRMRHAIVFSTGFMANLGVITSLVRRGDGVFVDAYCHASIIDACKMSGAEVRIFRHNDAAHLNDLMDQSGIPGSRCLVVVEGVYSVWGDLADLAGILGNAKLRGAVTLVDEAHGLGIYGANARGAIEELGVENLADIVVGTFSKSAGVMGGFSVTNLDALQSMRFLARSYLYTASLPPATVAAAREALRVIANEHDLRKSVWSNAHALREGLNAIGVVMAPGTGPIGGIPLPSVKVGLACWKALLAQGVYVNFLVPPATPDRRPVLRFSVSASHTHDQIDTAIAVFKDVWNKMGLAVSTCGDLHGAQFIRPADRNQVMASTIASRTGLGA